MQFHRITRAEHCPDIAWFCGPSESTTMWWLIQKHDVRRDTLSRRRSSFFHYRACPIARRHNSCGVKIRTKTNALSEKTLCASAPTNSTFSSSQTRTIPVLPDSLNIFVPSFRLGEPEKSMLVCPECVVRYRTVGALQPFGCQLGIGGDMPILIQTAARQSK
jgi:hypothetical protein